MVVVPRKVRSKDKIITSQKSLQAVLHGLQSQGKTIVLTGAMVPYAVTNSDAVFNLGCALSAVQLAGKGVYVAMNGRVLSWDNVRKNRDLGVFEPIGEDRDAAT